jgi:hypothetical protein
MDLLRFKCRVCKKVQDHEVVSDFGDLPEGIVCVECYGCGVMGIENMTNEVKSAKQGLLDEVGGDCA